MPRLFLIRHGEPTAAWGAPGGDAPLSPLGLAQAADAAERLRARGVGAAIVSPLKRCRETAAAFEMETGTVAHVVDAVAEIPSPAVADRRAWLAEVMESRWSALPALAGFRARLLDALAALREDTAVFSHFVAINAAVGAAEGRDEVLVFKPAHASITELALEGGRLRLVARGGETPTVNAL